MNTACCAFLQNFILFTKKKNQNMHFKSDILFFIKRYKNKMKTSIFMMVIFKLSSYFRNYYTIWSLPSKQYFLQGNPF